MTERPIKAALRTAVLEIEAHVAEAGWDEPARLFALVPTTDLVDREPELAAAMGIDETAAAGTLTPVEQEALPADRPLEAVLSTISWPEQVLGVAAAVERLLLPPSAEGQLPADAQQAEEYAAGHPDRQEVRIVAAATRAGSTYCAVRMRTHDSADEVLQCSDLVPGLLQLLLGTLDVGVP